MTVWIYGLEAKRAMEIKQNSEKQLARSTIGPKQYTRQMILFIRASFDS
jgi:hypothetical protein